MLTAERQVWNFEPLQVFVYAMEPSPSWEADRSSTSQEIRRIVCKKKVHYRI